jgi:hypothetical protein
MILKLILLAVAMMFCNCIFAQQEHEFGYLFKLNLNSKGDFYQISKKPGKVIDTIGYINGSNTLILKSTSVNKTDLLKRSLSSNLKGTISKRSGDTLFINFWKIVKESSNKSAALNIVNIKNSENDFIFVINDTSYVKGKYFNIPYRMGQFTATSLPFRVLLKGGKLESDFLNANVAYFSIKGRTKIFRNKLIKARNSFWGLGPYLGLSAIDNEETKNKEFGLNYGGSYIRSIQGLNLTVALGAQNGFKEGTRSVKPYLGFGIGFKLVEIFSPEIKDKD